MPQPRPLSAPPLRGRVKRLMLMLIAAPFSVVVVVLLLADRAPGITIAWLRRAWTLGSAIQRRLGVDLVDRQDLPVSFDIVGHFGLWLMAGVLAHALFARAVRFRTLLVWLVLVSASFEVAQGFLTIGRNVQLSDGIANAVGALAGLVLAATVAGIIGTTRRDRLAEA